MQPKHLPQFIEAERSRVKALRDELRRPALPDFEAERAALPHHSRTPGVRVVHVLGQPQAWTTQPTIDRERVGDVEEVACAVDIDGAIDRALDEARRLILLGGEPVSDEIHATRVIARRHAS